MYKYRKRLDPLDPTIVMRCEILDGYREVIAYVYKSIDKTNVENAAMICEALNQSIKKENEDG
jgi:hypothetical protein